MFGNIKHKARPNTARDQADRVAGAVLGVLIGDALGMGVHWYYNLDEMKKEFGDWVSEYQQPRPGRYHDMLKKGQVTQVGEMSQFLIETLGEKGRYDEDAYTGRLDELLKTLDGTRYGGSYTNRDMCDVWRHRVVEGKDWKDCGSRYGDTTDGIIRAAVLGARYCTDMGKLAETVESNNRLQFKDDALITQAVAFGAVIGALCTGVELSASLGADLREACKRGELPFRHAISAEEKARGETKNRDHEDIPEPDALILPGMVVGMVDSEVISVEPASKIALVYGQACAFFMLMPAAYYLAARYHDNFEMAVLSAVNGGGQNVARASLVGALVGAQVSGGANLRLAWADGVQVGLSNIPRRFIDGLDGGTKYEELAKKIGRDSCVQE